MEGNRAGAREGERGEESKAKEDFLPLDLSLSSSLAGLRSLNGEGF